MHHSRSELRMQVTAPASPGALATGTTLCPQSHSQHPKARAMASDLCTSWVFSCFSLLFRSPLVRLSFSSSVTFFSRKLTYNTGAEVG